MSTKMTGLDDLGFVTTAGDTGTLVTDGSLILGNADTDNITVNAEFASGLIPDVTNAVDLGSEEKAWRELYVGTRINLHGSGALGVRLEWADPTVQDEVITIPAATGTVALEGFLPSYIAFGKNNSQSAPLADFELSSVNGSANGQGWRIPVAGVVTHMSCQFDATEAGGVNTFLVSLWKNGVNQGVNYEILINNVPIRGRWGQPRVPDPALLRCQRQANLENQHDRRWWRRCFIQHGRFGLFAADIELIRMFHIPPWLLLVMIVIVVLAVLVLDYLFLYRSVR